MSLPFNTTTVTVKRRPTTGTEDAFDVPDYETIRTGLRAVIGSHSGSETDAGGASSTRTAHLVTDPYDMKHGDQVTDETTNETWDVVWAARRNGLGVDHTAADLIQITDRVAI